ncbi:histidine phosphatase family protein [Acinetobacter haemolyticus]|uniref:Histidine phosphatase family protein n=2 Tax=Acinetobacter haemolyticus TaxID=29430 RepID=A0A1L6KRY3_ACIHA|nr:histidine phosphatase family protein [Acinetobacter haemolyticus]APR71832.1 histidine phosphatase family protein [Acinetobacter haemolyticus]EFF84138.1 phosphoglycerate mutase family protein [Acinetobacter haemolyticus ATCC 19194]MBO3659397.1 histidine phosphatase family protein [Acinetobacter haemolyticus]NAR18940.1 histidine phosphatase family protein [Acinetobacter haemolyticus]NAR30133.1 histidine phosphatase family protein [Acinetobacter haemolyticus]
MSTIYLVRHGQASFGADSYDLLSAKGEQQAQVVGNFFKHTLKNQPLVLAGSMQRHQQTAQLALAQGFADVSIQTESAWNEFDHQQVFAKYDARFNHPELLKQDIAQVANPRAYLANIFDGAIDRWIGEQYDHEYHETWLGFQSRVEGALQTLCQYIDVTQQRQAVVFSSGGVISVAVGKVLGLNAKQIFALNWSIANASITTLRWADERLQLLSFNEHHYLKAHDAELLTWI